MKKLLAILLASVLAFPVFATTFTPGQTLTAAQLNAAFANAAITSGTIAGVTQSGGTIDGANIGSITPVSLVANAGTLTNVSVTATNLSSVHLFYSSTAPTISSGFGTGASIVSSNGSGTFHLNWGTGGTAASGVVALPTMTTGYNCLVFNGASAPTANQGYWASLNGISGVTITAYNISTAATSAPAASTDLKVNCTGY